MEATLTAWIAKANAFFDKYPVVAADVNPGDIAPMEQEATELIDEAAQFPREVPDARTFNLLLRVSDLVSRVFFKRQAYIKAFIEAHRPGGVDLPRPKDFAPSGGRKRSTRRRKRTSRR